MGHYYAEMACNRCGRINCICPRPPDNRGSRWINDDDPEFSPISVLEFDTKYAVIKTAYGDVNGMPMMYRLKKAEFKTQEEATAHSKVLLAEHIARLETRLVEIKATIKDAKVRLKKRK